MMKPQVAGFQGSRGAEAQGRKSQSRPFAHSPIRKFAHSFILLAACLLMLSAPAQAQSPSIHPDFPLLDENGDNVLESGLPVSTMNSCGACHDTGYIQTHSFHSSVGLNELTQPGQTESGRPWDMSGGLFGKWNPILYRYLTPNGDAQLDLGVADWIRTLGPRHAGGGPAEQSADGTPLAQLEVTPGDPATHVLDPKSGEAVPWDWQDSGTVEMNCFLCHLEQPNNEARIEALQAGQFRWAGTATLLGSGIVERSGETFSWNTDAFTGDGKLAQPFAAMQDPENENCGQCHGLVHVDANEPVLNTGCEPDHWETETTGQILSPQRMSDSGMNLAGKEDLSRAWDIHLERRVDCVDCHFSLNNPIYYQESDETRPAHLKFDARRMDIGDYLQSPSHQFARGQSAQNTLAPALKNTMRRCDSCHSIEETHDWLPYKERHINAISCESCHIPKLYSPARRQIDWTVITEENQARTECRGLEGEAGEVSSLITGFEPVLLARQNIDGHNTLSPYNLISSWYWVFNSGADGSERPVRLHDLQAVYLDENGEYQPDIIDLFDSNGNGSVEKAELVITTPKKEAHIQAKLAALGLKNPRIAAEIQPYSINHNVTHGDWGTKECIACHSQESRITQPMKLAGYVPGGVIPQFVGDTNVNSSGDIYTTPQGELMFRPSTETEDLYVLGYDNVPWVDWVGVLALLGTVVGIAGHGGLRVLAAIRMKEHHPPKLKQVYMYSAYERLWHWLQALAIMLLIFTGLIIHRPDMFGAFDFGYTVLVHNALGFILLLNAFLAFFYHIASGEIKQYLPQPRGFFNQMITQTIYYVRGIFRGEEHPYEKNPQKKLNPLQQVTYFGILNVLLPLQIITGVMIWGVQRWPQLAAAMGGLPFLAPFHTLIAWLFASFIIMHIYLTTTGHTPTANIKAMIVGWDEVEVHDHPLTEGAS